MGLVGAPMDRIAGEGARGQQLKTQAAAGLVGAQP